MIEETGRVVGLDGEFALVQSERRSSCGSCQVRKGCGTGALSRYFASRVHEVRVANPIGARVGEEVIVGIPESALIRGSLAVYLIPLLALMAGALFGEQMAPQLGFANSEPLSVLGGIAGLTLGLLWLRRFGRRAGRGGRYQAIILRRVESVQTVNFLSEGL